MGWNPLLRGVYLYAAIAIAYSVGLMAVVAIFRWAKNPSRQISKVSDNAWFRKPSRPISQLGFPCHGITSCFLVICTQSEFVASL